MPDYRIVPYDPAYYLEATRGLRLVIDPSIAAQLYAECEGVAYAGLIDGGVAIVAGCAIISPGVGEAWAIVTDLGRRHPAWITKNVIRGLRQTIMSRRLHRVQAKVVSEFYVGRLWIERMGFEEEGTLRRADPEGRDLTMYALLPTLPTRHIDGDGMVHVWRGQTEYIEVGDRLLPVIAGGTGAEIALIAIAAVGTAITAYSAYSQGQAQAAAQRYNARLAENQAVAARNAAQVEARQRMERYRRIQGANRATIGAAGLEEAGSPLLVMADNAAQAEMDVALVKYRGELGAMSFQDEARLRRFGGGVAGRSGAFGAGSTLLSGAYNIGSRFYTPSSGAASPVSPGPVGGLGSF